MQLADCRWPAACGERAENLFRGLLYRRWDRRRAALDAAVFALTDEQVSVVDRHVARTTVVQRVVPVDRDTFRADLRPEGVQLVSVYCTVSGIVKVEVGSPHCGMIGRELGT
jgi:hypothetical protein